MRSATVPTVVLLAAALAVAAPRARGGEAALSRPALPTAEADSLAERTGKAGTVIEAEPVSVEDDGLAECKAIRVLKGQYGNEIFRVRFNRVFGGAWPEKGVRAIFFLREASVKSTGGFFAKRIDFELISDKDGMAAPTPENAAVVQLAAAGKYAPAPRRPAVRLELPPADSLEGMVIDAPFVASGVIEEVSLVKDRDSAAKLDFRIEKCFKGDLPRGRIFVRVPAVGEGPADPARKALTPRAGPAALMFVSEGPGGTFRLLSPYRGCVGLAANEKVKDLDERLAGAIELEKRLRREGLVGDATGHESVAGTLLTWQRAWNAKEIENAMACYSRRSKWREKWESGPEGRRELTKVIQDYPARIEVVCDRIEPKGAERADVSVRLRIVSAGDFVEVRPAVMTFAFENGQWLIQDEGN
jgi:hypothetical protein